MELEKKEVEKLLFAIHSDEDSGCFNDVNFLYDDYMKPETLIFIERLIDEKIKESKKYGR